MLDLFYVCGTRGASSLPLQQIYFFKEPVLHTLAQSGHWAAGDLEICTELTNYLD